MWLFQRKAQPYMYNYQNALEAWLYGCAILLLVLASAYSAVPDGTSDGLRVAIEIVLLVVLLGSSLGAAVVVVYKLHAMQKRLKGADLSSVLFAADDLIDADLKRLLRQGTIRLLRCSWLMEDDACEASLGIARIVTGARFMPRLQDMPSGAFFPPDEALALFERGDRSVFVLSYGWNRCAPPSDPTGCTLAAVRRYLANEGQKVEKLALFWECARARDRIPCSSVPPTRLCTEPHVWFS